MSFVASSPFLSVGPITVSPGRIGAVVDEIDAGVESLIAAIVENGLAAPYPQPGRAREFKD